MVLVVADRMKNLLYLSGVTLFNDLYFRVKPEVFEDFFTHQL